MSVGENIKKLRTTRNITQQELGEHIGSSQAMIAQVERGTKNISLPLAAEIAKFFGITLEDLLA